MEKKYKIISVKNSGRNIKDLIKKHDDLSEGRKCTQTFQEE